jgi:hypothetical protein
MDIKVEEISVVNVDEEAVIDIKEEEIGKFMEGTAINIKGEEIPWDVTSPTVKAEEDQVSYTCVCPLLDTFYENSIMPAILSSPTVSVSVCPGHVQHLHCDELKCLCLCCSKL